MKKEKNLKITPYLYLVPSILIFAVFLFYPFVKTVYLSLFMTNKMGQAKIFVGLQNYIDLLSSESFRNSLKVTLVFVVIVVLGGMLLGLIAAVLCNKAFPGIRVFSTAYALPMAIASSSAAMMSFPPSFLLKFCFDNSFTRFTRLYIVSTQPDLCRLCAAHLIK